MSTMKLREPVVLVEEDLAISQADALVSAGVAACDIETSGLDWRSDRIGSCQMCSPSGPVFLVRAMSEAPKQIMRVVGDPSVRKVFHHAMFDLRFMRHHWGVIPANVACTKIAAKLVDPFSGAGHSLQALLSRYLNVSIDKTEQRSDWFCEALTKSQVAYAANDVLYLVSLLEMLETRLREMQLSDLARKCFDHLPVRVELDVLGYGDLYTYTP